ncbi:two-component system, NarL family, sensor histidine kinase UhpB [Thermoleophilum album]|uniref:histidine kinase n=1 Tax=Thermoleophilum album TaxID=29539 RepID=A0A1H6FR81_THEAL|nr:two-component system, NarL family, sensor histidine kinase UhpB [Thermoleophilum album]
MTGAGTAHAGAPHTAPQPIEEPAAAGPLGDPATDTHDLHGSTRATSPAGPTAAAAARSSTLFRRVFLIIAVVLLADALVFAVGPESRGAQDVLSALLGFGLVLGVAYWLMKRAFAPLRRLTEEAQAISSLMPGARVSEGAAVGEVAALQRSFNEMLARLEQAQRSSTRAQIEAQEEERRRIARELHDEIGQGLTTALLLLRRGRETGPDAERERLDEAREIIKDTLHGVRRILAELRPESLEELGLGSALMNLARRVAAASGIDVRADVPQQLPRLSREVELAVFRTAQEALTNVLRHARAERVWVRLDCDEQMLRLRVEDDGRGFDGETAGRGTQGMVERAFAVGGRLRFGRRADGRGTTVELEVPLALGAAGAVKR